jgi:hypothetical protein
VYKLTIFTRPDAHNAIIASGCQVFTIMAEGRLHNRVCVSHKSPSLGTLYASKHGVFKTPQHADVVLTARRHQARVDGRESYAQDALFV